MSRDSIINIKLTILAIQIIAISTSFVGMCARWDGGWFCFNGIPVLVAIALGPINLLIRSESKDE